MKIIFAILLVIGISQHAFSQNSLTRKVFNLIANEGSFHKRKFVGNDILLVDTFNIFTPDCNGKYGGKSIRIINSMDSLYGNRVNPDIFAVTGIGIKDDAIAISIVQLMSRYQVVYYVSIMGKDVLIKKMNSGNVD